MGSASGTDILETEKLVKEAKLQQNSSSTDDENIEGSSNIEEEVQDIGANDNDDANSAGMVYIDRNKVNGALANKQLIKVASILLPTLGVGALNGTAYHFLKKEDKNKEKKKNEEENGEKKEEKKENGNENEKKKEEKKENGNENEKKNEEEKVTGNLNTSTSVWWYVIAIVVVSAVYVYYRKNNKKKNENIITTDNNRKNDNIISIESNTKEEKKNEKGNEDGGEERIKIGDEIFGSVESYFKTLCNKCDKFKEVLEEDSACVKIKGKTIVVGDLHFNTGAALFVRNYYEKKLEGGDYNLVFLGDFIDRGDQAKYSTVYKEEDGKTIEDKEATINWRFKTLEIIMDLKKEYPDNVIVLSGNHEADVYAQDAFSKVCLKFNKVGGEDVYNKANAAFGELPKCAVLEQEDEDGNALNTFLVHGTVPYDPDGEMDLDGIVEKMSDKNNKASYSIEDKTNGKLVRGLVWNDYNNIGSRGEETYLLEKKDVELFKNANNIQRVISAHDHREPYAYDKDVNYIKVITSPNMNRNGKDGCILEIDEHGNITKVKVEEISYEKFRPKGANNIDNKNFSNNINKIIINNNNN